MAGHESTWGQDAEALRRAMVDKLVDDGVITKGAIEAAFRDVPRHIFLPEHPIEEVYRNEPIITKREGEMPVSSSSQPSMMAIMLEQLGVGRGDRVLEIGAATGYNAAILAHLVGNEGEVVTIEFDAELAESAREHLANAGYERVRVVTGDGAFGYPERAPYDRIIVTVGAWDVPPAWIEQLAERGRLVLPLALLGDLQESIAFERDGDHLRAVSHTGCGFVHMQGAFSRPELAKVPIGDNPNVVIAVGANETLPSQSIPAAPATIAALLETPVAVRETSVIVTERELYGQLLRWLAYNLVSLRTIAGSGPGASDDPIPWLLGRRNGSRLAVGLIGGQGLAFIARPADRPLASETPKRDGTLELQVRSFGAGERLARELVDAIVRWDVEGRPAAIAGVEIEAYPDPGSYHAAPGDQAIVKDHITIVLKRR